MDRGGTHTLSFINSGVNQKPVFLQNLEVKNAVPTVTDVLKKQTSASLTPYLFVRGSGFTLDTTVEIDGQARMAQLISSKELQVPLLDQDCASGIHPVTVNSPAPGGGNVSASYEVEPTPADIPSIVAKHSLLRSMPATANNEPEADTVADLITLTNAGKNVLRDATVTSVKLFINGRTFAATGAPQALPLLRPGNYSGVQVILPPHSSAAGDVGIIQVRGTVHGKAFTLSNRITMPAFIP